MSNINININLDTKSIGEFFSQVLNEFQHLSLGGVILILLAIPCPPLAVLLKVGFTTHFWINILLTILGWFPGVLHAWYLILFL